MGANHVAYLTHCRVDWFGEVGSRRELCSLDEIHGDVVGILITEQPMGERQRVIPPEVVRVQSLEWRKLFDFLAGDAVDRAGFNTGV